MKEITILVVEPGKEPYEKKIEYSSEENISASLKNLQDIVGGTIEEGCMFTKDPVAVVVNDAGKLLNLPKNRLLPYFGSIPRRSTSDMIHGTFIVIGTTRNDYGSLIPELVKKYKKVFKL